MASAPDVERENPNAGAPNESHAEERSQARGVSGCPFPSHKVNWKGIGPFACRTGLVPCTNIPS